MLPAWLGRTNSHFIPYWGDLIVAFTLAVNLFRGPPVVSLAAAVVIAAVLTAYG